MDVENLPYNMFQVIVDSCYAADGGHSVWNHKSGFTDYLVFIKFRFLSQIKQTCY